MSDDYDDLDDGLTYCVYCYDAVPEWKGSCCGENHFMTGFEIKEHEKELNEIDKRMKGASQTYDPPMTQTEEYLLKQQREDEHKSHGY